MVYPVVVSRGKNESAKTGMLIDEIEEVTRSDNGSTIRLAQSNTEWLVGPDSNYKPQVGDKVLCDKIAAQVSLVMSRDCCGKPSS